MTTTTTDIDVAEWRIRHSDIQTARAALTEAGIEHAIVDPQAGAAFAIMTPYEALVVHVRDAIVAKSLLADILETVESPLGTVSADFFDWYRLDGDNDWPEAEKAFAAFFNAKLGRLGEGLDSYSWVGEARNLEMADASFEFMVSDFDPEEGDFSFIIRFEHLALQGSVFPYLADDGLTVQIDDHYGAGLRKVIEWLRSHTPKDGPILFDGAHRRATGGLA